MHDPARTDEAAATGAPTSEQRADEDDDAADPADARDAQVRHVMAVVVKEGPVTRQSRQDEKLRTDIGFIESLIAQGTLADENTAVQININSQTFHFYFDSKLSWTIF